MKEKVAQALAKRVKDGDTIGIGSGSTVELAVKFIGERIANEKLRVNGVPTSQRISLLSQQAGINVISPLVDAKLDWAFDGADEIDDNFAMIKGGGAAMLNEKIIAERSGKLVIIVTEEKLVKNLGDSFPVPVEVIPEAREFVLAQLKQLGAVKLEIRVGSGKYGPIMTEHNNIVIDSYFKNIKRSLATEIKAITGVVESGLFFDFTEEVLIARKDGVWCRKKSGDSFNESKL